MMKLVIAAVMLLSANAFASETCAARAKGGLLKSRDYSNLEVGSSTSEATKAKPTTTTKGVR